MNCDLLLTENSCRFCLGDAKDGSFIYSKQKSFLCVERRLIEAASIFQFLGLKIHDEQEPDVPNKICVDCKKVICTFYVLKKNFQDNEAVLLGKTSEEVNVETQQESDPVKRDLMPIIDDFLAKHINDEIHVAKYTDKVIISPQSLGR